MFSSDESRTSKDEADTTPFLAGETTTEDQVRTLCHEDTDFDPLGDPDNPLEWPRQYKRGIVAMLAASAFTLTFNVMSIIPIADQVSRDIGSRDDSVMVTALPITIWELGEAVGCLLIAPLSELFGRYRVINICNLAFILMITLGAFSQTMPQFIVCRGLTGAVVAANVLNPAIIGDILPPEQRGTALSIVQFVTIFGGTIGTAVSGSIAEFLGWRFVIGTGIILASICHVAFLFYYRETYKPVILRQRTTALCGKWRGRPSHHGLEKPPYADNKSSGLMECMVRPALVLYDSSIIAALAIFGSVAFAHYCIQNVTLPPILENTYGMSPVEAGTAFLVNGIGSITGVLLCKFTVDRLYVKLRQANQGVGLPEHRLPMAIVAGFMLPLALLLYGLCAEYKLPLAIFLVSVAWTRLCIVLALVPVMAYVVDACNFYSASAVTGIILFRCISGSILPLFTVQMVEWVGYRWGYLALSALSLGLSVIPILIMRFGSDWRRRSRFTSC